MISRHCQHEAMRRDLASDRACIAPPLSPARFIFQFVVMGVCTLAMFGVLFAVASL